MAKEIRKKVNKTEKSKIGSPFNIYWKSSNYYMLGLGFVLAVIGFVFMTANPWDSTSALVISPIVLFLAYLVIFPLSIFYKKKEENDQGNL